MGKADAVSSVSGSILLFLLAASLCTLTAASIAGMLILPDDTAGPVPEVIAIGEIHHENPAGIVTYAGRLYLIHVGTEPLDLAGHDPGYGGRNGILGSGPG